MQMVPSWGLSFGFPPMPAQTWVYLPKMKVIDGNRHRRRGGASHSSGEAYLDFFFQLFLKFHMLLLLNKKYLIN